MLHVSNLRAGYGAVEVLKDVCLDVPECGIVAVIGANGAGKSTLLRAISGLLPAASGEIAFRGKGIANLPPHEIVAMGISHVPEGRRIFPKLTVRENLEIGGFLRTGQESAKDLEYVHGLFPILAERERQLGGTLSGGQQQMLAIARALMSRPRLLLLDEPSLGLAPIWVEKVFDVIRELSQQGVSLLLVEQNARAALQLSHFGYVIEAGRVVLADKSSALLEDPRVKQAYLGS